MKRLGFKGIAAGLSLLLTASLAVPATAAAAGDVLLISPSPAKNVLVLTQEMVDSEGEFVLSGEDFDKVIVPADVKIDCFYVDGCEIGELTVEGGNNPEVQLWDAKIDNVVVSPALYVDENAALKEYLALFTEDASKLDVNAFLNKVKADNAKVSSLVPEISLMGADMASSEQEIGAVTLGGNAKVDFTDAKAETVLNVAFDAAQTKMDVTVTGYKGDIAVAQTTSDGATYGRLNIQLKKSEVADVTVDAQGNANVTLRSSDSTAKNVALNSTGAGAATLTLAADAENVAVAETSSKATVKVLADVENADLKGKGITMELASYASVANATVAGEDMVVTGSGDLGKCKIADGTSASVGVYGADVAGKNTYNPSGDVQEEEEENQGSGSTVVTDITLTSNNPSEAVVDGNKVTYSTQYKTAVYAIPADIDLSNIESISVEIESDRQVCIKILDSAGTCINDISGYGGDMPNYGVSTATAYSHTYAIPEGTTVAQNIEFMSLAKDDTTVLTVKSITIKAKGSAPAPAPAVTLTSNNPNEAVVDGNKVTYSTQYKTAVYAIPADIDLSNIASISVEIESDRQICIKINDSAGACINDISGYGGDMPNYGVSTATAYSHTYSIPEDTTLARNIEFMSLAKDDTTILTVKSITVTTR